MLSLTRVLLADGIVVLRIVDVLIATSLLRLIFGVAMIDVTLGRYVTTVKYLGISFVNCVSVRSGSFIHELRIWRVVSRF